MCLVLSHFQSAKRVSRKPNTLWPFQALYNFCSCFLLFYFGTPCTWFSFTFSFRSILTMHSTTPSLLGDFIHGVPFPWNIHEVGHQCNLTKTESEAGVLYQQWVSFTELGHSGQKDWKRGWVLYWQWIQCYWKQGWIAHTQKWQSNLASDFMTHRHWSEDGSLPKNIENVQILSSAGFLRLFY